MPDFRDIIAQRVGELDQMDVDAAARAEQDRARTLRGEAEARVRKERALRLGMEVVDLLQGYEIETTPIWKRHQAGRQSRRARESTVYSRIGEGWEIYKLSAVSRAIDTKGQLIDGWDTTGIISVPKDRREPRDAEVAGIVDPSYAKSLKAIDEIENDRTLQLGIASLISGRGVYRG